MSIEQQESLHFLDYWRVIRSRKEIIIAVSLLVLLTGILVTFAMPKVYRASTVVAVRQEMPDVEVFKSHVTGYDPYFMRTQFERIQSRPIVEETVRKLNLVKVLGSAYGFMQFPNRTERTIKLVGDRMRVRQYRDTNLIEIQMLLSEPKETANELVARVANTIAEVFRDQRIQSSRRETERALRALHASLEEQNRRVTEAEEKVEQIRAKYKLNVVSARAGADMRTAEQTGMMQLEYQRRKLRVEVADKESRLKQINSLSDQDLLDAAPTLGDDLLAQLVAEKRRSEVERKRLLESYGRKHPKVVEVSAVIQELDQKIDDALEGMKTGIRVEYEATREQLAILEAELEALKNEERARNSVGYREFDRAVAELAHTEDIRDALEARYLQEQIEMRIPRTIVDVVEPAVPSSAEGYVSPNIMLNVLLSILVGLGSGVALAYFIEYLDTSVKTVDDVEGYIGVPVLGVIPQKVRPLNDPDADAAHGEAYRILRTNIRFSKRLEDGRALTITSGSAGEGKSLTLFNLAYVSARLGERVLIVDSDLHRPTQHKVLSVKRDLGLANVLVGEREVDDCVLETDIENLFLLPSGKLASGHHGLLDTLRMKDVVAELKSKFGLVLFDAPPITGVSDASLLVREMDGTLLVIQHRKHPKAVSNRAKAMIQNVGGNLIGVVLNNINISRDYSYYYYGHYYSYSYARGHGEREQQR